MPVALLALTLGAFAIGTTEFVVVGLLPDIAADYTVSIPTAGLLVTGYALGVVAGAPVMTGLGTRVSRKRMLLGSLLLLIAGNLLSAVAPSFALMLTGRIIASLAHGAFFGIGAVVAGSLVAADRKAGAIAIMFTGLTAATVVGVPLGTLLGQQFGWRLTFALVAVIGVIGLIGVAALIPDQPAQRDARLRAEFSALANPQVLLAMAMTVLGFGGVFAAITYLAPMMTDVAGYADSSVTWLLVLFGLGMFAGNLIGGRYADRHLMPMLYLALGLLAAVLALFTVTAHSKPLAAVTVVLIGALGFATVPPLQKRVLDQAASAPTLASAINIGAFNLGNALAAWLGGLVISAGLGYTAPNWVGALLAASALGLAVVSARLERGAAPTPNLADPGTTDPSPIENKAMAPTR
ncbi:MFS transporter [Nocardia cyriacigeorgica]|uniref:MFS transporter n=1 Tax=Nocardia cyriacigeorgica TaxID=135487 RepID=UPI001895D1D3|nr:MFS transporter [Nocardia cyriacigeorgica]MBF6425636.1 MFS transporter [Nocardia cyriacigeorgica]